MTAALLVLVACFSMFVVTIPGEAVDRLAVTSSTERSAIERGGRYVFGYALPATVGSDSDSVLGMFRRNIQVVDQDLVVDKDVSPGEATLNLRNRDLRFARLDRSDLHQADLTGANLDGASLVGADLRGVVMQCASLDELLLTDDRRAARCASARAASFYKARMSEARMAGIDLRGARMEEARLDGADLSYGLMIGTDFASAQMERANLERRRAAAGRQLPARLAAGRRPVGCQAADGRHGQRRDAGRQPFARQPRWGCAARCGPGRRQPADEPPASAPT